MMTLIALAISVAFVFSVAVTLGFPGMPLWEELATLVTIMLLGHWIEMRSIDQAQGALAELAKLLPGNAVRITLTPDGAEHTEDVPIEALANGDLVLVRPGASIPADGEVREGHSNVNEAMITGESRPVLKVIEDHVIAGTVNGEGSLRVAVTGTGERTALAGIMRLVEQAQTSRSRAQVIADRAAYWLTLVALGVGVVTFIAWLVVGAEPAYAVERLVTVLVIACPHALGLAVPLVIAISTTIGARNGLLVRDRRGLEEARLLDAVVFDKTGTLTLGEHRVVGMRAAKAGMFDTVIYDEASQMPVEYALPTLFRSKVVVVSGDDKQMPPTSFFSSKVECDEAALFDGEEPEDDASEEERDAYTETWNRREIKDCPDLLHLARVVLPTKTLQIHYRSAYRELIAFSNASFYGNRLSVPVRHPDDVVRRVKPIEVIRSNGLYQNQSNIQEAADVVRYLSDLWRALSPPSVGVVTFNRKQADIIEEAIEDRAQRDHGFRDVLMRERERVEDGEDMGFFVKNVENVQGDERDVVVFSSTFGRNGQGTFRRNFGVLGQTGGERRLNVAVTRARKKIVLMTSMPVELISEMHSHRHPPATPRDYLQAYMDYAHAVSEGAAETGRALLDRLVADRAPERSARTSEGDGFSDSVEAFLREEGWEPAPADDGGAFGLDFAIENPRTGLYAIGIECDAPRHRILETARAREVWRPSVLRHAVPHVHRVSSYAWMHTGDAERARLKAAVDQALSANGRSQ
jgi:hypothetical protein